MKRPACLLLAILLNGCVIRGPYLGTRLELGANAEVGIFVSAKPIGWNAISNTYKLLTEDEKECTVED